jgi:hypothetical protein
MGKFTEPVLPGFDLGEWAKRPYFDRLQAMCVDWSMRGFGIPPVAYLFYVVKIVFYVGGFVVVASFTPGIGGVTDVGDWWHEPIVFQKAVLWTLLFEVLGLGCGSGPLTGRMNPPFTAPAYFARPGTVRLPPFRWVPFTAGDRRTVVDAALYVALLVLGVRALFSAPVDGGVIWPVLAVGVVLGLRDKTVFLAMRAEHYLLTTAVFLSAADGLAGAKAVQLALWMGAATSKLNHHFPSVMTAMLSNHPFNRSDRFRRALYRDHPTDMRSSKVAAAIAHGATVVEYTAPLVLAFSVGGWPTTIALVVMVCFHFGILSSFPLGVPLEWNVFFIYSAVVLFGHHSEVRFWEIDSPWLIALLLVCVVLVPVVGNLKPAKVSFLPSMRYYAGNWAASVWVFRPGVYQRIHASLVAPIPSYLDQVDEFVGPELAPVTMARGQAFRSMHLQGRALNSMLAHVLRDDPEGLAQLDPVDADRGLVLLDGELVAATALGWNFGEGHLHHEQLLAAISARCPLEPGDLRCVFLESQPLAHPALHWRVVDAARGQLAEGHVKAADLVDMQPWDHDAPLQPVA